MMSSSHRRFNRRTFLRGAGGAMMALPALQGFALRAARGATPPPKKICSVFMMQLNGHIESLFYPRTVGPLDPAVLGGTDADRMVNELKDHAADVGLVRGLDFCFGTHPGCGHPRGGNMVLTGSKPGSQTNRSLPASESADYRIGDAAGNPPLNLYAGKKDPYLADNFAYGPGGAIRVANNKPYDVYQTMMGLTPPSTGDPGASARLVAKEKSINDILRAQIQDLLKRPELSADDKRRLDVHFQSIRELEITMARPVPVAMINGRPLADAVASLKDHPDANELMEDATRAQLALIALAFATDQARSATLQIGAGQDQTRYTINGMLADGYHSISHAEGMGTAAPLDTAQLLHHQIDRIHARHFKFLIEQLKMYQTVDGRPLLDDSVAVWTNQLSNGSKHDGVSVPHVYAGSAGGFLKTGLYVQMPAGTQNSKFLNTIITAAGVRKANGDPVDDFGDPANQKGLLTEIVR